MVVYLGQWQYRIQSCNGVLIIDYIWKLDTDDDPYSIKGFLSCAHGLDLEQKEFAIAGVSDLKAKPAVMFQAKYYWYIDFIIICFTFWYWFFIWQTIRSIVMGVMFRIILYIILHGS